MKKKNSDKKFEAFYFYGFTIGEANVKSNW